MEALSWGLRWVDLLDVLVVTGLFWVFITWVREARARVAIGGMAIVAALYGVAGWLELGVTLVLLRGLVAIAGLVLVVVFRSVNHESDEAAERCTQHATEAINN